MSVAAATNIPDLLRQAGSVAPRTENRKAYRDMLLEYDPNIGVVRRSLKQAELLEPDWDDENGKPASSKAVELAKSIIAGYAAATREITFRNWIKPDIGVRNDGSLTLYWKNDYWQVYLTIPPAGTVISVAVKQLGREPAVTKVPVDYAQRLAEDLAKVI